MENLNSQIEVIIRKHISAAVIEVADFQKNHIAAALGLNGASNGASNGAAAKSVAAAPVKSTKVSAKKPTTKKVAKTVGKAKVKSAKGKTAKEKAINAAKGVKRDPALLQGLMDSIHKFVSANPTTTGKDGSTTPGVSIEAISKALETASKDLTLPMKKLIASKKITTKGQKRATRYFAK